MEAFRRTGVQWKDEFLILGAYREAWELEEYQHLASPDTRSGIELCIVGDSRYWRYDCYASISPYGWHLMEEKPIPEYMELAFMEAMSMDPLIQLFPRT